MPEEQVGDFTVEVEKEKLRDDIEVKKLKLFHQECLGGRVEFRNTGGLDMTCQRCKKYTCNPGEDFSIALIRAAVIGEETTFERNSSKYDSRTIKVVQKK